MRAAVIALLLLLGACVANDAGRILNTLVCGEGTTYKNGECVRK